VKLNAMNNVRSVLIILCVLMEEFMWSNLLTP